ncbi:unnamed protein product [Spirodela intermedia]|uniref:Uncharacterized protein n=1 Tax=Spirodela intermedia TaxID=51605 RepID=A0A7I8IDM2_SPIIN|nr:unnamed protein product [Spirodela intermedia]CAA6655888.1 unnamed protein product [Spirodela intermedia]
MGNCMVRRSGGADDGMVRVMTSGGADVLPPPHQRPRRWCLLHRCLLQGVLQPTGFSKKQESEAPPRCTGANLGSVARRGAHGVWKVKLVISPAQLADILSQDTETEALIESVRR